MSNVMLHMQFHRLYDGYCFIIANCLKNFLMFYEFRLLHKMYSLLHVELYTFVTFLYMLSRTLHMFFSCDACGIAMRSYKSLSSCVIRLLAKINLRTN